MKISKNLEREIRDILMIISGASSLCGKKGMRLNYIGRGALRELIKVVKKYGK